MVLMIILFVLFTLGACVTFFDSLTDELISTCSLFVLPIGLFLPIGFQRAAMKLKEEDEDVNKLPTLFTDGFLLLIFAWALVLSFCTGGITMVLVMSLRFQLRVGGTTIAFAWLRAAALAVVQDWFLNCTFFHFLSVLPSKSYGFLQPKSFQRCASFYSLCMQIIWCPRRRTRLPPFQAVFIHQSLKYLTRSLPR